MSTPLARKIDPIWRTRRWLEECKLRIDEEEIEWWPLICPLMDWSDMAVYTLVMRLLVTWHWTVKTSRPLIYPPALTILNTGQFLNEDVKEHGWDVQDWLEAYTCALQQVTEAAKRRCWMLQVRDFTPKVLLLVEAFAGILNIEIPPVSAVSCSDSPPACIPHQRNRSPLTHVISYLDEGATHQPMCKAWNVFV